MLIQINEWQRTIRSLIAQTKTYSTVKIFLFHFVCNQQQYEYKLQSYEFALCCNRIISVILKIFFFCFFFLHFDANTKWVFKQPNKCELLANKSQFARIFSKQLRKIRMTCEKNLPIQRVRFFFFFFFRNFAITQSIIIFMLCDEFSITVCQLNTVTNIQATTVAKHLA